MRVILFDHNPAHYPVVAYGGIERLNQYLFETLVDRGHDVELWINDKAKYQYKTGIVKQLSQGQINDILTGKTLIENCDIFHSWTSGDHQRFKLATSVKWSASCQSDIGEKAYADNLVFASIKQMQKHLEKGVASKSKRIGYIYNSINLEKTKIIDGPHDKLIWFSGIRADKGVHLLPGLASKLGEMIHVFGTVQDWSVFHYLTQSNLIRYHGEIIGDENKNKMFAHARVYIHTATFDEPGGLTLMEAMACGIPVVGLAKGALPEEVQDPENNLSSDIDGLAEIIKRHDKKLNYYQLKETRQYAESRFSKERMTDDYLRFWEGCI